jgi:hypothetical protein
LLELRLQPFEQREGVGGRPGEAGDDVALGEGTLRALCLMTVWPIDTCPSPAMTTLPPFLTETIVVPCQEA